jgi:nitroreductase
MDPTGWDSAVLKRSKGDSWNPRKSSNSYAAAENLLLAAANLGLGAVWCGIKEHYEEAVRKIVGAPSRMGVLGIIPIGYPAESPAPYTKYRKSKVHWDRY